MKSTFRGSISIPLEMIAQSVFGLRDKELVESKYYKLKIEENTFAEVMCNIIIREAKKHNIDENDSIINEIRAFTTSCKPYLGKYTRDMPDEVIDNLYREFCDLYNKLIHT